jgi:DNA-directed RNA polymerase subunit K/omega
LTKDGNEKTKIVSGPNSHLNAKTADIFLSVKGTHNQMGLYMGPWIEMAEFALDKMETMPKDKTAEHHEKARELIGRALNLLEDPLKNYDRAVILAKGAKMLVYGADNERKGNKNIDPELVAALNDLDAKIFAVKS